MKLTTLPWNAGQSGASCGLQAGVIIRDNQLYAAQTALGQIVEKLSPMHFGLGKRHRYAQHSTMTGSCYANRHQHRAINYLPAFADALIAGIQKNVGRFIKGAFPPCLQTRIQQGCGAADLRRKDFGLTRPGSLSHIFGKNVPRKIS